MALPPLDGHREYRAALRRAGSWTGVALAFAVTSGLAAGCDCGRGGPGLVVEAGPLVADVTGRGEVVATVSGRAITTEDVAEHARANGIDARAALDDLIEVELLTIEAEKRGLAGTPEVRAAGRAAMARRLLREIAAAHGPDTIPDESLLALYTTNKHWLVHAEMVWTSHILALLDPDAPPDQVEASRVIMQSIRDRAAALPSYCHTPCSEETDCDDYHSCLAGNCSANGDADDWCAIHDDCEATAATDSRFTGSRCEDGTCARLCTTAADCGEGSVCRPLATTFLALATDETTRAMLDAAGTDPADPKRAWVRLRPEDLNQWWPADLPATAVDQDWLKAAHALATPGTISAPIRSSFGWHVIMLEARSPSSNLSFEEARDGIADRAVSSFVTGKIQELLTRLREEHEVHIDSETVNAALARRPSPGG